MCNLDEVDGLLSKRGRQSEHETARRMKNEFLQSFDGVNIGYFTVKPGWVCGVAGIPVFRLLPSPNSVGMKKSKIPTFEYNYRWQVQRMTKC